MRLPYSDNDNSAVHNDRNPASARTYNSYMRRGGGSYYNQDGGDFTYNNGNCGDRSSGSQLKYNYKPPHISNLRSILSDTISNLTKGDNLKKGESVELTLEIELMKTLQYNPTNSLVEVTIIQHNKSDELDSNDGASNKILANKMPFQVEIKSSESVPASQKRRNWFQRVITRQFQDETLNEKHTNISQNSRWKMQGDQIYNKKDFENDKQQIAKRNRFVTILPEEIPINADFTKGYRKVSPPRRSPRNAAKQHKPRNIMTASRKDSLVKKLSDIFLPSKKAEKSKAVETALTALKHEVDNIKLQNDTRGKKKKRAPVLGKLVSNILVDMMESSENTTTKNEIKGNSKPFKCKSFFEPVPHSNWKIQGKKSHKAEITPSLILAAESRSDTCCMQSTQAMCGLKIKRSTSESDCRAYNPQRFQEVYRNIAESTQDQSRIARLNTNKRTKMKEKKFSGKSLKKNSKEYTKRHSTHQINNKKLHSHPKRQSNSKKTLIEWNGQKLQVHKDIKGKIEKLIVKELQNLALKEGMECDVTPLPSTTDSSTRVGKISSFICELDISGESFKKAMRNHKSVHKKLNLTNSLSTKRKKSHASSNNLRKNKSDTIKIADATKTTHTEKRSRGSNNQINNVTNGQLCANVNHEIKVDDVEVKYMNSNMKNWSAESNSIVFQNSEVKESLITSKEVIALVSHNSVNRKDKAFSSGFVRKIKSNDSTWNKFSSNREDKITTTGKKNLKQDSFKKLVTVSSTKTTVQFNSSTSTKYESSIEIELDIRDLELILKEAKEKQKAEKVLISAKCKRDDNRQRQLVKFTGKNSPSYTNHLLLNACKRLEKCAKTKHCH